MSAHMSDKKIVELMVLPAIISAIVISMKSEINVDDDGYSALERVISLLDESLCELADCTTPDRLAKLARRTERLVKDAAAIQFDKLPRAIQYLTMANLIVELSNEDMICIGAESPFSEAWDIMTKIFGGVIEQQPEMVDIASVEVRHLRDRLASLGYFKPST